MAAIPEIEMLVSLDESSFSGCIPKQGQRVAELPACESSAIIWPLYNASGDSVTIDKTGTTPENDASDSGRSVAFADPFQTGGGVHFGMIRVPTAENHLELVPPQSVLGRPAVYIMEMRWKQANTMIRNEGLLLVAESLRRRALFPGTGHCGPPTLDSIRSRLRDSPEMNDIWGVREFSAKEIMDALMEPVRFWNETPPATMRYGTVDFPHHSQWREATVAHLLKTSAIWMQRNQTQLAGEGIVADPRAKWTAIQQLGSAMWQTYVEFVHTVKRTQNLSNGFRII